VNSEVQHFDPAGVELKKITPADYDLLEAWMMSQPGEIEIDVTHRFAAGLYIRQGTLPAGSLVLGHSHKEAHHVVILKGRMTLLTPDAKSVEIVGPCEFIGQPGRKLGLIHEELICINIHATAGWPAECHTDIDAMEEHLYARTEKYKKHRLEKAAAKLIA
jgi:hypothetical protein